MKQGDHGIERSFVLRPVLQTQSFIRGALYAGPAGQGRAWRAGGCRWHPAAKPPSQPAPAQVPAHPSRPAPVHGSSPAWGPCCHGSPSGSSCSSRAQGAQHTTRLCGTGACTLPSLLVLPYLMVQHLEQPADSVLLLLLLCHSPRAVLVRVAYITCLLHFNRCDQRHPGLQYHG